MDHFSPRQIENKSFVNSVIVLPQVNSTNNFAKELLRSGKFDLPTVVIALKQIAGRGRENKSWWSGDGSLCFSLIVSGQDTSCIVSIASAIAVCQSIRNLDSNLHPKIKWPNDVMLHDRKLCGILIESVNSTQSATIIGIGINTNCSLADADENTQRVATSILDVTGSKIDQQTFLIQLLDRLNSWISKRRTKGIIDTFTSMSQFETGQSIRVESSRFGTVTGEFGGIGTRGELILSIDGEPCVIESATGVTGI